MNDPIKNARMSFFFSNNSRCQVAISRFKLGHHNVKDGAPGSFILIHEERYSLWLDVDQDAKLADVFLLKSRDNQICETFL